MAQYSSGAAGWTPAAFADGGTLTNSNHHSLRAWSALETDRIVEVFIGGEAASSSVDRMAVRRHSTQSVGPTNVAPAPLHPGSAVSTAQSFVLVATTQPVIASTQHLVNLAFNSFGGVVRWVAAPGEELYFAGNTAATNEVSLSAVTGTGIVSSHFIHEQL